MSANKGLFKKYLNRIFIETGSNYGDGIQQALDEGFEVVYSVDILQDRYEHCKEKFKDNPNVFLIHNDTLIFLRVILPTIDEPVTFWLDAHKGNGKSPLLKELEIIKNHSIKTHTLLLDDLRDWNLKQTGFDTEILKKHILQINPEYKFILEDGYVPKDILVAKI